MGGTIGLPRGFRLSPFMIFNSGAPYNATAGQDLSDDLLFNDRPAFATNVSGSCLSPRSGLPTTRSDQCLRPIPINYLTGPNHSRLTCGWRKRSASGRRFVEGTERSRAAAPRRRWSGGGGGPVVGGLGRGPGGGGFGGMGPATSPRYNLTFSVNARNMF